jgi:hypothetical protein
LCGVSADVRALEVDHIVPRSRGGTDAPDNLQAERDDSSVEGFNVGVNDAEAAGQTIFHCHLHLIPRRRGDVEEPMGGVRNVIPGKGVYR